jgi:hypothetical protein
MSRDTETDDADVIGADLPDRAVQPEAPTPWTVHANGTGVYDARGFRIGDFPEEVAVRIVRAVNEEARAASQERPQPPFRTDSDLLDAYQDCIEREEAREAKPDLWDDIYGEDGTAAQERPSIDVDARRLFDLLWDERGALDAGIEGFSPNRYRSAARRILWRLSSPVPVEPGE